MNESNGTNMTLLGLSGGVKLNLSGVLGTATISSETSTDNGYEIEVKTQNEVEYQTINVTSYDESDPANFTASVYYTQPEGYDEVDLDVDYSAIPAGTSIEVNCSNSAFTLSKQGISGAGLVGKQGMDVGPLEMSITMKLWFDNPEDLTGNSTITLKMNSITGTGGPVKKTLLEQIVINLVNNDVETEAERKKKVANHARITTAADTKLAEESETWDGIVVRCNTNEGGTVPRGSSSNSPDIILAGTTPLEDPSVLTDPANYNNGYDKNLYIGKGNYLYVRGKNYTEGTLEGTWNLFYSPSNILLYPYLWEENKLATSDGNQNPEFSIAAGEIGASENSFAWIPDALPSGQHYCMIGIANTEEHGNPLAGVNNISSLAEVLSTNANIAQRNVKMITTNDPIVSDMVNYDQGSEAAIVDLTVLFKNIPKGSSYTIASGTPLNGKTLSHSESNTTSNDFKYGWVDQDIPANWRTAFTYTLTLGSDWTGIPDGEHPTVEIRGELVQGQNDRLFHLGRPAEAHFRTGEIRTDASGGPVRILTVGSYRTVWETKR